MNNKKEKSDLQIRLDIARVSLQQVVEHGCEVVIHDFEDGVGLLLKGVVRDEKGNWLATSQ